MNYALDYVDRVDAVGVRGVIQHHAMRERRHRDVLEVFARDVGAAIE
jgi:hypothetical protein